ncbi:MAG: hypothetical protein ACQEUZ_01255 [Pseudomonadota bacterium]
MKRLSLLALAPLLAACVSPGSGFDARMDGLMGRTQLSIVRDLGVPDASVETEEVRILRWSWRDVSVYPGGPWFGRGYPWPQPHVVTRDCDLEIEFGRAPDGPEAPWRAETWRARGNDCR